MDHEWRTPLSPEEKAIYRSLVDPNVSIDLIIPKRIEPDRLLPQLHVAVKAINRLEATGTKLKVILGRILVAIQDNPSVYEGIKGVKTFDDFITVYVCEKLGLGRTNLYEAKRLAMAWPRLAAKDYDDLRTSKLLLLSQFTSQEEPGHKKYLEEARTKTVTELRAWAVRKRLIEAGIDQGAILTIPTNKVIAKEWKDFISDPRVQSWCQTKSVGEILHHMIQECSGTWLSAVDDQNR